MGVLGVGVLDMGAQRTVEEQRLGFVATVNDDGTPNLSPKGTLAVLDADHLVFANIRSPGTIHNLRQRPAIEINVVDPIGRQGYRFRGTATVVDAGAELDRLLSFYQERGSENAIESVVVIRVERAERVISPAYDLGLTEPEVRARWRAHFAALDAQRQPG
jgi:predicted pyridoxine 5'-phosphate oxidase superfamily flavin-nucleotide-binding protein